MDQLPNQWPNLGWQTGQCVPAAGLPATYHALKAGKSIRFVGAGGQNNFDQYNNSQSGYILVRYDAQGNEVKVGQLTPEQTKKLSDAGGI